MADQGGARDDGDLHCRGDGGGSAGQRRRASSPSSIVLGKSIAGFDLHVTPAQVEKRLGKPGQVIHVDGKISGLTYYDHDLSFDFDTLLAGDPADLVGAFGGSYRTSKGIHIGSSRQAVSRAYPGLKCNAGICDLYQGTPGALGTRNTGFDFLQGKVDSIAIQIVDE